MTTIFAELPTMQDSLSGGTTNLLRMARSGCGCAVSFVALALEDGTFATARYSSTPDEGLVGREALDELVTQLWQDPRIGRGEPVVRSIRLGGRWTERTTTPLAVAVVPLGDEAGGAPWGMVGVADPGTKAFGGADIELLGRIGQRMASYLKARNEVQRHAPEGVAFGPVPPSAAPASPPPPAAPAVDRPGRRGRDSARSALWWAVDPGAADVGAAAAPEAGRPPTGVTWSGMEPGRGPVPAPPPPFVPPAAPARPGGAPVAPPAPPVATPPTAVPVSEVPVAPPAATPSPAPVGEAQAQAQVPVADLDPYRDVLGAGDLPPGLIPVGALLGRTGRLLGAATGAAGALAVVVLEVEGSGGPFEELVPGAVRELRAQLRFDDPLARIGRRAFAAVVPLVPGGSSGELVEARLADALRAAAAGTDLQVRSAHVVADIRASHDADELLRSAVGKLRAA